MIEHRPQVRARAPAVRREGLAEGDSERRDVVRGLQRRLQDLVDGRLVDARHGDDERRAVHEAPDDVADEDDGQRGRDLCGNQPVS